MIVSTQGIVLQTTKYSDNSLIVKIFTLSSGVVSFIIKNVYSKKSKQPASYFAPLTILDIVYKETCTEALAFLKEVSIAFPFHAIPLDIRKNSFLLFYQELLLKLLHQAIAPDEPLYNFLVKHLISLDTTKELNPDFHIVFLVHLLQTLGYAPEMNFSMLTPYFSIENSNFGAEFFETPNFLSKEASYYFFKIMKNQNDTLPDKKTRMELLNGLILYLVKYHKQIKEFEAARILSEVLH